MAATSLPRAVSMPAGVQWVASVIRPSGMDHTGRGNRLAHHRVLDADEVERCDPAQLLCDHERWMASFSGEPRELDVPAFQDTYGWIAYRQGKLEDARTYLEPAAAGLPDDPLVQFHLGMTYADLGENEKAIDQLTRAVALAGQSSLPQFEIARAKLRALQ